MKNSNFSLYKSLFLIAFYTLGCAISLVLCYLFVVLLIFLISFNFGISFERMVGFAKVGAIGGLAAGLSIEIRRLIYYLYCRWK